MIAIIAIAGIAVCLSLVCSLLEAALLSISSAQVEQFRSDDRFGAKRFAALHDNVDVALAALMLLRVLVQTAAAVWCGVWIASEPASISLTTFALGLGTSLFLASNLFGRCLGARFAAGIARSTSWPVQLLVWCFFPIVKVYAKLAHLLRGRGHQRVPTEDEIMFLSRLALENGRLRPQEVRWV